MSCVCSMIRLKGGFKQITTLNLHLKYENYEPLCLGMATVLPHYGHFMLCHNVETLDTFSEVVKQI